MNRSCSVVCGSLLTALIVLLSPGVAQAKRGGSAHATPAHHESTGSAAHAAPTRDAHDGSSPALSLSLPRAGARDASPASEPVRVSGAEAELRRLKNQQAEEKALADAEAARKLEASLTAARQQAAAAQAAQAEAEERKRREAEQRAEDRERARQELQQRQYAWEARCQIKPVMSDDEIRTCREVWTRPVPKDWNFPQ